MNYIFLEPYIYYKVGKQKVLLVNLMNDEYLYSSDKRMYDIVQGIKKHPSNVFPLNEQELEHYKECISLLKTNLMGNCITFEHTPIQFTSEINMVEGREAQKKVAVYSRTNQGRYLSDITLFTNYKRENCFHYLKYLFRNEEDACQVYSNHCSQKISCESIIRILEVIRKYQQVKSVTIVGLDLTSFERLLSYDIVKFFLDKEILHVSMDFSTIREIHHANVFLGRSKCKYEILVDCGPEDFNALADGYDARYYVPLNTKDDYHYFKSKDELKANGRVIPFYVLSKENVHYFGKHIGFSEKQLLDRMNLFRVIRTNNCLNTTYMGKVLLFAKDKISFGAPSVKQCCGNSLEEELRVAFSDLSCDWFKIREYSLCKDCVFQYLCPPPSAVEDYLRRTAGLDCLMENKNLLIQ